MSHRQRYPVDCSGNIPYSKKNFIRTSQTVRLNLEYDASDVGEKENL